MTEPHERITTLREEIYSLLKPRVSKTPRTPQQVLTVIVDVLLNEIEYLHKRIDELNVK